MIAGNISLRSKEYKKIKQIIYLPRWTDAAGYTGLMAGAGHIKQV